MITVAGLIINIMIRLFLSGSVDVIGVIFK